MEFDLDARQHGAVTVVAVRGDLDVLTAPRLRDHLAQLIDSGARDLRVDLRPCEFVDSSGLSALVTAMKRARASGGDVSLVCPKGNIRRLIEIVALDQVFTLHDDLDGVGSEA